MARTLMSSTGHTMHVQLIDKADALSRKPELKNAEQFSHFWEIRNWDGTGHLFMYLGRGNALAPTQIVAWYPNGQMWSSFGKTQLEAINGAITDGWKHAV